MYTELISYSTTFLYSFASKGGLMTCNAILFAYTITLNFEFKKTSAYMLEFVLSGEWICFIE